MEPSIIIEHMRFWKKQKGVEYCNFSERGVLAGTHSPNIVLSDGSGYMLDWPGDHERAVEHQRKLSGTSDPKAMQTNEIYVPEAKCKEIYSKSDLTSIVEKSWSKTFFWQNQEYIYSGSCHKGGVPLYINAYRVEPLETYKGPLAPLKYGPHFEQVDLGNRERSYAGMLLTNGQRNLVVCAPEYTFKQLDVGKQLSIF